MNTSTYWQAGHGKGNFLGKDDSCDNTLAIYMKYLAEFSRDDVG